jgi:hypothetical protein
MVLELQAQPTLVVVVVVHGTMCQVVAEQVVLVL